MSWDGMIRDEELRRRRELSRMTKVELIGLVVRLEHAATRYSLTVTTDHTNGSEER